MLRSLTVLLACQLAGEVVARLAELPVPGPVLGMVLLLAGLLLRGHVPAALESTGGGLLRYLSLLYVPAGVGILVHLHLLAREIVPIAGAVLVGTLIAIGLTGWVMQAALARTGPRNTAGGGAQAGADAQSPGSGECR